MQKYLETKNETETRESLLEIYVQSTIKQDPIWLDISNSLASLFFFSFLFLILFCFRSLSRSLSFWIRRLWN